MKILYVAPRFHTNQYYAIQNLAENHEIEFWTCYSDFSEVLLPISYKKIRFNFLSLIKANRLSETDQKKYLRKNAIPSIKWILVNFIKFNPDVVVIREWSYTNLIVAIFSKIFRKKCVLYNQYPVYSNQPYQTNYFLNSLYQSHISPVYGTGEMKSEKSFFVPFVINPEKKLPKKYAPRNKIHLLIVGKYTKRKRILEFLSYIKKYNISDKYYVTVVGQATTSEQIEYFEDCQRLVGKNVELLKNIPHREMEKIYLESDVFILTSRNEPASYSILEAMKYGMTIFSPSDNGTSCYVNENINGYIYPVNDFGYIFKKMDFIITVNGRIEEMGGSSIKEIEEKYSPEKYTEALSYVISR